MKTYLCYPMIFENKVIGMFGLSGKDKYDEFDIEMLTPLIGIYKNIELSHQTLMKLNKETEERIQLTDTIAKTKSSLIANMSHEIRTPMNGIFGMLSLKLSKPLASVQLRTHNSRNDAIDHP